jgi:hypothetical protein
MRYCQQVSRKEINLKPVVSETDKEEQVIEITVPDGQARLRLYQILIIKGVLRASGNKMWHFKPIESPKWKPK